MHSSNLPMACIENMHSSNPPMACIWDALSVLVWLVFRHAFLQSPMACMACTKCPTMACIENMHSSNLPMACMACTKCPTMACI